MAESPPRDRRRQRGVVTHAREPAVIGFGEVGARSAPTFFMGGSRGGFSPNRLGFGTTKICRDGELVPFAMTSSPCMHFSHANVQRGLAAAPFAIPAPGRKSPLRVSRALFPSATGRARQYVPVLSCPRTGSIRCVPACGETARPIFLSRSKTLHIDDVTISRVGKHSAPTFFMGGSRGEFSPNRPGFWDNKNMSA